MNSRIFHPLILLAAVAPLLASAQLAHADDGNATESIEQGRVALRGSVGIDLDRTINIGGQHIEGLVVLLATVAGSYFVDDRLSVDLDLDLRIFTGFLPLEAHTFGATPGVRYYLLPQVFLRGGLPTLLIPDLTLGIFAGAGIRQRLIPDLFLIAGLDYTYWLSNNRHKSWAPLGRLDVYIGGQLHF